MRIEMWDGSGYWVIYADSEPVGDIRLYIAGWKYHQYSVMFNSRFTRVERDQIFAAAKQKETLLNITRRLLA